MAIKGHDDRRTHRRPLGSVAFVGVLLLLAFSAGFNFAMFHVFLRGGNGGEPPDIRPPNRNGEESGIDGRQRPTGPATSAEPPAIHPPNRNGDESGTHGQQRPARPATSAERKGAVAEPKEIPRGKPGEGRLSCNRYGGPPDEVAAEMVYWYDIPNDAEFVSPFKKEGEVKYMTFEPDVGGWNNIRMAMETMVALAHAMGRTLVMPPKTRMYLLTQEGQDNQTTYFNFADFFDLEALGKEHLGIDVVSMEQFLQSEAMAGRLVSNATGQMSFPPKNRTNWDGGENYWPDNPLNHYLRYIANTPNWRDGACMAVFPAEEGNTGVMKHHLEAVMKEGLPSVRQMEKQPLPVDAPTTDRMRELCLGRKLCIYDEKMQRAPVVHFRVDTEQNIRLLVHFYAFLFFEDWRHDLHLKRLIRDHLKYLDELQCAAARVVAAVRDRARKRNPISNPDGLFDTMHIRRGDFQYKITRLDAGALFSLSKTELTQGSTVYIATDEKDKSFFRPFSQYYDVCFLDDFRHLLQGVNTNYFGMIEQLIASRGRIFYGTFPSTFTGYINRLRGYHADKQKLQGHENGEIQSYYFFPKGRKMDMRRYRPVHQQFWMREFPAAWRNINKGVEFSIL